MGNYRTRTSFVRRVSLAYHNRRHTLVVGRALSRCVPGGVVIVTKVTLVVLRWYYCSTVVTGVLVGRAISRRVPGGVVIVT